LTLKPNTFAVVENSLKVAKNANVGKRVINQNYFRHLLSGKHC